MKQRRNARARQLYKHWVHCVMVSKVVCSFRQRAYSEILAPTWRSMWTSTTRVWVSILVESVIMLSYLASMRTWRFLCLRTVLMLCNWKGIKCLTDKHWSDRAACCKWSIDKILQSVRTCTTTMLSATPGLKTANAIWIQLGWLLIVANRVGNVKMRVSEFWLCGNVLSYSSIRDKTRPLFGA